MISILIKGEIFRHLVGRIPWDLGGVLTDQGTPNISRKLPYGGKMRHVLTLPYRT